MGSILWYGFTCINIFSQYQHASDIQWELQFCIWFSKKNLSQSVKSLQLCLLVLSAETLTPASCQGSINDTMLLYTWCSRVPWPRSPCDGWLSLHPPCIFFTLQSYSAFVCFKGPGTQSGWRMDDWPVYIFWLWSYFSPLFSGLT